MFRIYRRWGAAPRIELDPGYKITPTGRWVGELRGADPTSQSCAIALDLTCASGIFVGEGMIEDPAGGPSFGCTIEGDEHRGAIQALIWLHKEAHREPLIAHGRFRTLQHELDANWRDGNGESGSLLLQRI